MAKEDLVLREARPKLLVEVAVIESNGSLSLLPLLEDEHDSSSSDADGRVNSVYEPMWL